MESFAGKEVAKLVSQIRRDLFKAARIGLSFTAKRPHLPRARVFFGPACTWDRLKTRIPKVSIMLILCIVWAVVTCLLLALLAYRGTLTRYEEDQLFLDPAENHQQAEQTEIVNKVNRVTPLVRIMTGATCVLSAVIIGVYVWDAISQFK